MNSAENVELKILGQRILKIQETINELRSISDIDRRNNRALYDNLTFEVVRLLGTLDAKLEALAERLEDRLDQIEDLLRRKDKT